MMKWKYYIPHIWDRERQIWEDVYLLPCHPEYHGESIWLTIDALGEKSEDASDQEEYQTLLEKLGDNTYHIHGTDMLVRANDFTKAELVEWVMIWLEETGFPADELQEAPLEDFANSNDHVRLIGQVKTIKREMNST